MSFIENYLKSELKIDEIYEFKHGEYAWEAVKIRSSFQALCTYFAFLEEKLIKDCNSVIARDYNNEDDYYFDKDEELFDVQKVARYSSLILLFSNFEYTLASIYAKYSKEHFGVNFEFSKKDDIEYLVKSIDNKILKKKYLSGENSYKLIHDHLRVLRNIVTHNGGVIYGYREEEYKGTKRKLEEDGIILYEKNISKKLIEYDFEKNNMIPNEKEILKDELKILIFGKDLLIYTEMQMSIFLEILIKELDLNYVTKK